MNSATSDVKRCGGCKQVKSIGNFSKNRSAADGLQCRCVECQSAANKALQASRRLEVYRYLLSHPCVDCGEADLVVLEFDHVRGSKVLAIGTMVSRSKAMADIWAEIAKCEVRCANCHRRRTAKTLGWRSLLYKDTLHITNPEQVVREAILAAISQVPEWRTNIRLVLKSVELQVTASLGSPTWRKMREYTRKTLRERLQNTPPTASVQR